MRSHFLLRSITLILICTLCMGCHQKSEPIAPFSDATWTQSLEDIISIEQASSGSSTYDTTVSIYGGYSYIFPKDYLDFSGSVQYMFDDKEKLAAVAWFLITDNPNDIATVYDAIYAENTKLYGQITNTDSNDSYHTCKWKNDVCDILLITFSQNGEYALQYSYLPFDLTEK